MSTRNALWRHDVAILYFLIDPSIKIHLLNAAICAYEYYYNSLRIIKVFEETQNEYLLKQIKMLIPSGVFCCTVFIIVSIAQKAVESEVWKLAQENYMKSENLTQEVVQAMEAKDTFVSMLSHEIRNPLNSLKGSIDFLLQVVKDYEYIQVLKNAKMSGDILLNLVSNVLDAAKLKSDKMEIACTETDLIETVKKVYTINSEKFKEKELSVRAFIDEAVPRLLWIDPSRLLQILMNLISNAVKFTPKNGKINMYVTWCHSQQKRDSLLACFKNIDSEGAPENKAITGGDFDCKTTSPNIVLQRGFSETFEEFSFEGEISHKNNIFSLTRQVYHRPNDLSTISMGSWESTGDGWSMHKTSLLNEQGSHSNCQNFEVKKEGFLKIQISDTGSGIEENDLQKMFGMFEQSTEGSRNVHGGTGLGLWICKQLCHRMKGDITVYSKRDKGSSFVLYFPVDNKQMNEPIVPKVTYSRERIRALVVDDYSVNRYLHKLLLEQEGVQVTVACNGKEAVEKFKYNINDPFDFIMMDVQMPEMDGFTAAKVIRDYEVDTKSDKVDIYFVIGEYFNEEEIFSGFRHRGGTNEGIKCLRKPLGGEMINKIVTQYKMRSSVTT